jgi:hypothetical protein
MGSKDPDQNLQFPVVMPRGLRDEFLRVARANETTGAQVLRSAAREYIAANTPAAA